MKTLLRRPSPSMVVAMSALFVAMSGVGLAASQLEKNSVGPKQIEKNAVRGAEIKNGAVGPKEIPNGSLTGADIGDESLGSLDIGGLGSSDVTDESLNGGDVENGSLRGGDVEDGSLNGGDVEDEGLGSADIAGLGGGDVTPGTFLGGSVTVQFQVAPAALADSTSASYDVHCPDGQIAIGGASRGDVTDSEFTITTSSRPIISTTNSNAPTDDGTFTGWRATVLNPTGGAAAPPPQTAAVPPDGDILPQVWVICARVP